MQLRILAIALLIGATGFIMPRPSQSNNALNEQLQAAICGQNWYRAIQIIQNMKRLSPRDAGRLAAYQSRLQALAENNVQLPDWSCSEGGLPTADSSAGQSFTIPILGRSGGIPVVAVTFNDNQTFPMLFDTGASTTFILPQMAAAIQPQVIGEGAAVVADGRVIPTIIAEVETLQVGDLTINNAIVTYDKGGTGQNGIGLLGQSVYGEYDVLIGEDTIELRQRASN